MIMRKNGKLGLESFPSPLFAACLSSRIAWHSANLKHSVDSRYFPLFLALQPSANLSHHVGSFIQHLPDTHAIWMPKHIFRSLSSASLLFPLNKNNFNNARAKTSAFSQNKYIFFGLEERETRKRTKRASSYLDNENSWRERRCERLFWNEY